MFNKTYSCLYNFNYFIISFISAIILFSNKSKKCKNYNKYFINMCTPINEKYQCKCVEEPLFPIKKKYKIFRIHKGCYRMLNKKYKKINKKDTYYSENKSDISIDKNIQKDLYSDTNYEQYKNNQKDLYSDTNYEQYKNNQKDLYSDTNLETYKNIKDYRYSNVYPHKGRGKNLC